MRTSWVFVVIVLLVCGCTKTVQHRVASYYPGAAPTTQPVPKTAVYSVRFLDEKGKKTGGIPDSHRLVAAGEHVGFSIDEDKRLIAVAGKNSFPIEIPSGYGAVWSTTYTKQTQFSREMNKAARTAGKLTGYIAVGIVEGIIEGGDDDDCDDTVERHIKQERRAHRRH